MSKTLADKLDALKFYWLTYPDFSPQNCGYWFVWVDGAKSPQVAYYSSITKNWWTGVCSDLQNVRWFCPIKNMPKPPSGSKPTPDKPEPALTP